MAATPLIRILHLRADHVDFDRELRERVIPGLRAQAGLLDLVAGRQGPDQGGPRIIVTVWDAEAVVTIPHWPDAALTADAGPHADALDDGTGRLEIMPVLLSHRDERADWPAILRVFRGRVRAGEFDRYVEEAGAGTRTDAALGRGPIRLYLAAAGEPDSFVTVSTWSSWAMIEAATGGDVRRPVATRHPERLEHGEAAHYETIAL